MTRIKLCREPTFIYRRAGIHQKCMRSGADTGIYVGAPRIGEGNNAGVKNLESQLNSILDMLMSEKP